MKTAFPTLLAILLLAGDRASAVENAVEVGLVRWGRDLDASLAQSSETGRPVFLLFQELVRIEPIVITLSIDQITMIAFFGYLTFSYYQYPVCSLNGRESMCNNNGCSTIHHTGNGGLNKLLSF